MEINPVIGAVPLLVGGFVFGQAIHSLAVIWQSNTPSRTHREQFQELLKGEPLEKYESVEDSKASEDIVGKTLLRDFYQSCDDRFDELQLERFENRSENSEKELEDLYTLVRGVIHFDGRGRSRTFQAIYAFCRSVWVLSIILWAIYYLYVVIRFFDVSSVIATHLASSGSNTSMYTPLITDYISNPEIVFLLSTGLFLSSHKMFRNSTDEYKEYFTEYMISDFVLIEDSHETKTKTNRATRDGDDVRRVKSE